MPERREERGRGTTPREPTVPPAENIGAEHSFTLQMVTQLHGSVGELKAEVRGLLKQSEKQETKLDKISHQIYAAIVLLAVAGTITGFILNKIWDLVAAKLIH
jgi:hypothetical protein